MLTFCLPNPNIPLEQGGAPFGAKLVLAQLNFRGGFTAPTSRGTYRWHIVATPWSTTANAPNVAGTVDGTGHASCSRPRVTLSASSTRRHVLTIRGSVLEADTGVPQRSVVVRVGNRRYTVRTNAGGAYRLVVRFKRPTSVFRDLDGERPGPECPVLDALAVPGRELRDRDAAVLPRHEVAARPCQVATNGGRGPAGPLRRFSRIRG